MPYGPASNCVTCKFLTSQVLLNDKEQRVCADCLEKEYKAACVVIQGLREELFKASQNTQALNTQVQVYEVLIEQIKNLIK